MSKIPVAPSPTERLRARLLFALCAVALGALAGGFVWLVFFVMNAGIELVWHGLPEALGISGTAMWPVYPLVLCVAGGAVIGLWEKLHGAYPQSLETVMGQVKATGRYEYKKLGPITVAALLPLVFGGSVGPEAGLTGVIAGLCTWVGDKLRRLGGEFAELAQVGLTAVLSATFNAPLFGLVAPMTRDAGAAERDPEGAAVIELPKTKKLVVYLLSIAGALGAMVALRAMFGAGGGLPHFEGMDLGRFEVALLVPLALAGGAVGWLYHAFDRGAQGVSAKLGERPVAKGALAGLVLAACGIALPFTMFAGEHQATELGEVWTSVAGLTLVATALVKVFVTPLCVRFGWRGGHFFPVIFAGIALGFGMAQLTGVDAIFAVCTCTAGLVGAVMRKPLLTVLLLFLCFPVKAAPILLAAAAIGSALPLPKGWGAAH